jgi:hypothetical protein
MFSKNMNLDSAVLKRMSEEPVFSSKDSLEEDFSNFVKETAVILAEEDISDFVNEIAERRGFLAFYSNGKVHILSQEKSRGTWCLLKNFLKRFA